MKVISFINLTGCKDDLWNEPKGAPVNDLTYELDIAINQQPGVVFRASPENRGGDAVLLNYTIAYNKKGLRLKTQIDRAGAFEMVVIQYDRQFQ